LLLRPSSALSGCYTLHADLPGTWRDDVGDRVEVVSTVDHTVTRTYFIGGLIGASAEHTIGDLLIEDVRAHRGDGYANVVVETFFTPGDLVMHVVTLGAIAPRTLRVRADIVRIAARAPRGRALTTEGQR
jgi:hypothetical protein